MHITDPEDTYPKFLEWKWDDREPVFRIFHGMENYDFSVYVRPKPGAPDTRRAALYCEFMAEEWFDEGAMLTNLGIAALLVQFYDHMVGPRVDCPSNDYYVDLYSDREYACGETCLELMADQSLARKGLKRAMHPFLDGIPWPVPVPSSDE